MEGTSTAISVLLVRFKKLPRVCYYDNACNLGRSIVLRVPWVNDTCFVVCDRFHYPSRKCNSICDPGSYNSCSNDATSGAESINQLQVFSKSHMRFLRPSNVVPFLAVRAVYLNVKASIREVTKKSDLDVSLFQKYIQENWERNFSRCIK